MNQIYQGESSGGPSVQPVKRRRGRPRKDPALKHAAGSAHPTPVSFDGQNSHVSQQAPMTVAIDPIVGQEVTGVVEASFDAVYLLRVRIGNSDANFRGIIFKPGHYIPISAENDIAPHLQMIRRNDVQNIANRNPGKRKYTPPVIAPVVSPVGSSGTLNPVLLQPVNFPNGMPNMVHMASDASTVMDFGDKDVHVVEPISMLPPPVNQIFMAAQTQSIPQMMPETELKDSVPVGEGVGAFEVGQGEKAKQVVSADNAASSPQTSDNKTEKNKELVKSSPEESSSVSKLDGGNSDPPPTESLQTDAVPKPFSDCGTGRMTELLDAVQENMEEKQGKIAEQQPSESIAELQEPRTEETDPKNEAGVA